MHKLPALIFILTLLVTGCANNPKRIYEEMHEDDVRYAVDASFQPIFEELKDLYALRKPEATMLPIYCSEDSAVRLIIQDTLRMAITTRPLSEKQKKIVDSHKLSVIQSKIAYDAFALIVNRSNPDTVINLNELRQIVQGKITDWKQLEVTHKSGKLSLVFDASGSSTVRYMKDSLNGGRELKGNLFAQGSNLAVLKAVKENPDVIGVVSTDWLRVHRGDTAVLQSFQNLAVNVMLVGKVGKKANDWQRPYQYYIATGEYPRVRSVWAILTDPRSRSCTRSFYFFLKDNVGQRVICNSSQLLPRNQVQVREVSVN